MDRTKEKYSNDGIGMGFKLGGEDGNILVKQQEKENWGPKKMVSYK